MAYQATNFPAAYRASLVGAHTLTCTWAELLWAAVSVGRAELLHLMRYGPFSAFEIVYRAAILFANAPQAQRRSHRRAKSAASFESR
jgi:hypothetical protein